MTTMNLAPELKKRFFTSAGVPLSNGLLYTYAANSTTPQVTYTNQGGSTNQNPVQLDANGYADVWLDPSLSYKFVLKDSGGVTQWTVDNVVGLLGAGSVVTASLADGSVTTAKLADLAVTNAKLSSSASVDADRAVGTDSIKTGAVTAPKVGTSAQTFNPLNVGLSASVASNALTVSLKTAAGATASSSDPIVIPFRDSTASTGTPVYRQVTGALSVTVSSGSTLGHPSAKDAYVWVYAIDNAGTVELAVAGSRIFDEGTLYSTTMEGGAGAADASATLYSTTARSNVPVRLLGRLKSNQSTAGTWATAISEVALINSVTQNPPMRAVSTDGTDPGIGGIVFSASSGNQVRTDTSFADVTSLAVTLTTTGRPVRVFCVSDAGSNASYFTATSAATGAIRIIRGSSTSIGNFGETGETAMIAGHNYPPSTLDFIDNVAAGTYTYKVQAYRSGGSQMVVRYIKLVAYEI